MRPSVSQTLFYWSGNVTSFWKPPNYGLGLNSYKIFIAVGYLFEFKKELKENFRGERGISNGFKTSDKCVFFILENRVIFAL